MIDPAQTYLQRFVLQSRPLSSGELALKQAIEDDPRVVITGLQVRRRYKSDPYVARSFRRFVRDVNPLVLLFDFKCPCGEIRREVFQIATNWHLPDNLKNLCDRLRESTYKHLASEGLI